MKRFLRVLAIVLAVSLLFGGCGGGEASSGEKADPAALYQALVTQVTYDTELSDLGEMGAVYFPELPEGATVQMHAGSGYFADKVVLITVAKEADAAAARKALEDHLAQLRTQFQNYIPEEVPKIDDALIWEQGTAVILCITGDDAKAKELIQNAASLKVVPTQLPQASATEPPTEPPTEATEPPTEATEPPTEAPTEPEPYPVLTSQSGTYSLNSGVYQVDNSAFEGFGYSDPAAQTYADILNQIAAKLKGKTTVYALTIPTAIGVVLPDDIAAIMEGYEDQGACIDQLFSKLSEDVKPVVCFDNLMRHRGEYLYFQTDHHWTGRGAYYAYEAFCETKGVAPYTLSEREVVKFEGFQGSLYKYLKLSSSISDTVFAYRPVSESATMTFTDSSGNTVAWNIIHDVSDYPASLKYSTFAGSDNPYSEFHNPEVTDGSVCIVVKESFGCALMPYLVDHYSTIYEIDYRYWSGSLTELAERVGATDMIFANNIMRISGGLVSGDLVRIS